MILLLKLLALAAACFLVAGVPTAIVLMLARKRRQLERHLSAELVGVIAAATTVIAFVVALSVFGPPDNSWVESHETDPNWIDIRWRRDRKQ